MSLNQKVAEQLYQIGEILTIKGDRFRSRAYNMAAQRITALTEDVGAIATRGELDEIPSVGKSITMVIEEIIEFAERTNQLVQPCDFYACWLIHLRPVLVVVAPFPETPL